jgi:hypothetical protein
MLDHLLTFSAQPYPEEGYCCRKIKSHEGTQILVSSGFIGGDVPEADGVIEAPVERRSS